MCATYAEQKPSEIQRKIAQKRHREQHSDGSFIIYVPPSKTIFTVALLQLNFLSRKTYCPQFVCMWFCKLFYFIEFLRNCCKDFFKLCSMIGDNKQIKITQVKFTKKSSFMPKIMQAYISGHLNIISKKIFFWTKWVIFAQL